MRRHLAASLALAAVLATTVAPTALAQDEPVGSDHPVWKMVLPIDSVGGQTYEEWIQDYGEWLLWERTSENPPPDLSEDCNGGQPGGDVFFVPHTRIGVTSEYACTVGADQYLALLLGGWIDWVDDGQTREQALAEFYEPRYQGHGFEFTLDDVTVPVGNQMYFPPEFYSVDIPEDSFFGLPAGPRDVFLATSFVILEPLDPGEHTLNIKNSNFDPGLNDGDSLLADAVSNLTLTVEEPATAAAS